MTEITLGGKMSGVCGIRECSTCRWARIHHGSRVTGTGNKVCTQNAAVIVDCTNTSPKMMDMSGEDLKCSGYAPRKNS